MAVWKCSECGNIMENRCKPQKCKTCGAEKGKIAKDQGGEKSVVAESIKKTARSKKKEG